jgi:hypothetical protein
MRFTMEFDDSNAAFVADWSGEISSVLADAAERVNSGHSEGPCRDSNGNTVGRWTLTP